MELWIDAVIGICVFHRIRQAVIQAVAGAAADYLVGVVHNDGVFGVQVRENPALVSEIIASFRCPPLHKVAPRFMISGEFHQAQVGPAVAVHITKGHFHSAPPLPSASVMPCMM